MSSQTYRRPQNGYVSISIVRNSFRADELSPDTLNPKSGKVRFLVNRSPHTVTNPCRCTACIVDLEYSVSVHGYPQVRMMLPAGSLFSWLTRNSGRSLRGSWNETPPGLLFSSMDFRLRDGYRDSHCIDTETVARKFELGNFTGIVVAL